MSTLPLGCGLISVQTAEDPTVLAGQTVDLASTADFTFSSSATRYSWMQLHGPPVDLVNAQRCQHGR